MYRRDFIQGVIAAGLLIRVIPTEQLEVDFVDLDIVINAPKDRSCMGWAFLHKNGVPLYYLGFAATSPERLERAKTWAKRAIFKEFDKDWPVIRRLFREETGNSRASLADFVAAAGGPEFQATYRRFRGC